MMRASQWLCFLCVVSTCLAGRHAGAEVLQLDASARPPGAQASGFKMGSATSPTGHTLTVDSRGLVRDGVPWVTISGEFHFSRCPADEWRDELLKMKAGGIGIVTTYIFWIHHEEQEGVWDWSGQRDLKKFLETCQDVGIHVLLRVGPWCHGEVRNGGFPNWLQAKGDNKEFELRRDNPAYLGYVQKLYTQIAQQMQGELWKDGGPVIGIQLENEYGGPTEHLMTLKRMAQAAGMDVPLYTCTGWGSGGSAPFGEMVPMSGAYAEGFWDRSVAPMPGGYAGSFRFSGRRGGNAAAMGAMGAATATSESAPAALGTYPFMTCELGAGMMPSYHRRVLTYPQDAESLVLVKAGSGVNLLGLYMYHGGENPDGKLGYLNETQATRYWNDLPVKNYDFQAPVGEFGQEREHYHWLRELGLFLQDFGPGLSGMAANMPTARNGLGWSVRSDGRAGYIFVSNYQRLSPQPVRTGVQFQVKLAGGDVTVPAAPVSIKDDTRFIWPLNMDLNAGDLGGAPVTLISATAQPICHVDDGATRYTVFKQTGGIATEFVFDAAAVTVDGSTGKMSTENGRIILRDVQPGTGAAVQLHGKDGKKQVLILLDEPTALDLWKGAWQGHDHLFLTHATFLLDGAALRLRTERPQDCAIAILPAPAKLTDGKSDIAGTPDGLFTRFVPAMPAAQEIKAVVEKIQAAGPPRTIPIAPSIPERRQGMAMQPEDADFAQAAVWHVALPAGIDPARDLRLVVHYTGDVIRAYHGDQLLNDDFYAGRPFDIGLRRFGPAVLKDGVTLKILPLRQDAPIYFTDPAGLKYDDSHTAISLDGVDVVETREVRLEAGK